MEHLSHVFRPACPRILFTPACNNIPSITEEKAPVRPKTLTSRKKKRKEIAKLFALFANVILINTSASRIIVDFLGKAVCLSLLVAKLLLLLFIPVC